jgi:hypothetical protein
MFECLKYIGSTISSKAFTLWIRNEHPPRPSVPTPVSAQLTMLS